MVVESGPVQFADQEHEEIYEDDDDDDVQLSAAQLMGQEYGHGENFVGFSEIFWHAYVRAVPRSLVTTTDFSR